MVDIETVLVLGAGASKAFDFPTGEELVKRICLLLSQERYSDIYYKTAGQYSPDAERFPKVLKQANPFSVDAWLEHNPNYILVGKVAIAIALLCYEKQSNLRPENNWYQLLFKRLNGPFEEFQNNKLSIITFNYDRSLEQYLFDTFRYTHTVRTEEECKEKLNHLRILHVYGSMGCLEWQFNDPEHKLPQVRYGADLDKNVVLCAANSIKIIPEKNPDLPKEFQEARKLIAGAKALYFLGFGYNQTNMERLGIETLRIPSKKIGTIFKLGFQEIQEVRRMNIFSHLPIERLLDVPVYEFLYKHVDFNSL